MSGEAAAAPGGGFGDTSPEPTCVRCGGRIVVDAASQSGARCQSCGEKVRAADDVEDPDAPPKAPWHFKVLLFGTAGYLVYRLIWFIFWLTGHAWHG